MMMKRMKYGGSKVLFCANFALLFNGNYYLLAPGMDDCVFESPYKSAVSKKVTLSLWDIEVFGLDCGEEPSNWVSKFLGGKGLRLIQHSYGNITERKARGKYLKSYPRTFPLSCVPMYADVSAYMMTTEPSLLELRSRMPGHIAPKVDQRTFRPNIVINGDTLEPWEEDGWVGEVKIGGTEFSYNKDCTRCGLTLVIIPFYVFRCESISYIGI